MTSCHELAREGWDIMHDATRVRCYARGGLVTVGATIQLAPYVWLHPAAPMLCTLLGRGRTIEEAVTDLGRHGVF